MSHRRRLPKPRPGRPGPGAPPAARPPAVPPVRTSVVPTAVAAAATPPPRLNPALAGVPMPPGVAALPVDRVRGFPVPWFVAWVDGKPEFRAADQSKFVLAVRGKLCWVCGGKLGLDFAFVAGPMCGLNRTSAEPPSHPECALYSVRACPFLTRPHAERREAGLDALGAGCPAGHMIRRNPGVSLLWHARSYALFNDGRGGVLIRLGEFTRLEWFAEGRPATRAEVAESVRTGLPALLALARQQDEEVPGSGSVAEFERRAREYESLYPGA